MNTRRRSALLAFAVTITILPLGCGAPVKTPTSYAKWEPASDAIFAIDYPEGWVAAGDGKNGIQWAEFKKGGCLIKCNTNISSSAIGDITQSFNNIAGGSEGGLSEEEMEDLAPAASAHAWNLLQKPPSDDYSKYKEEKDMVAFKSGLGDARKSIFTGTVGGRSVKGYRATFLARDRGVTVFCHCAAKDFDRLQPAFDKVLESVRRGNS